MKTTPYTIYAEAGEKLSDEEVAAIFLGKEDIIDDILHRLHDSREDGISTHHRNWLELNPVPEGQTEDEWLHCEFDIEYDLDSFVRNSKDLELRMTISPGNSMEDFPVQDGILIESFSCSEFIKFLQLDPILLQDILEDDLTLHKDIEGLDPIVDINKFIEEIKSSPNGASLTILFSAASDTTLAELEYIPKGSSIGFFNSTEGSTSAFEAKLLRNVTRKEFEAFLEEGGALKVDISPDRFNTYVGYSIDETFGEFPMGKFMYSSSGLKRLH